MSTNFDFTIGPEMLVKGLRPFEEAPRDSKFLVESKGAMGRHGVLAANQSMAPLDTSVITDGFPYPQIFAFSKFTIVCGATSIYEIINNVLTLKITVAAPCGGLWNAVDFYDYIYMSNGEIAVRRDVLTGEYTECTSLPVACAMCNYNGQVLVSPSSIAHTYTAGSEWTRKTDAFATVQHVFALSYEDAIYGVSNGELFKWDGISAWDLVVPHVGTESCIYTTDMIIHGSRIYKIAYSLSQYIMLTSWSVGETVWTVHFEYDPLSVGMPRLTGGCKMASFGSCIYMGSNLQRGRLYRWQSGNLTHIGTDPDNPSTNVPMVPVVYNSALYVVNGYYSKIYRWNGIFPVNVDDSSTLILVTDKPSECGVGEQRQFGFNKRYTIHGNALYMFLYEGVTHRTYFYKWDGTNWIYLNYYGITWVTSFVINYDSFVHYIDKLGALYTFNLSTEEATLLYPWFPGNEFNAYGNAESSFMFNDKLYALAANGMLFEYTAFIACTE